MKFSKNYFEQFKYKVSDEKKDYDSYYEATKIDHDRCLHSNVKFKNGALICSCGASWTGPKTDLIELQKALADNKRK